MIADASSNANSWTSDLSEDAEVQQLLLVQQQLTKIGFDLGSEAGQIGPRTQQALKAYVSLKNPRVTHDLMAQALIDLEMLARLERGVIYQAQGNIWEAMNEYDTAARLDPSNGDAHFHRAEIYHDVGLPELAIAGYEAALYLDQKHFRAYHGRGDVHFDRGHYWLALADHTDGLGSRIMGDAYLVIRGNVIDAKELVAPQVEAAMLWAVGAWNQAREVFAKKIRSFNEEDKQETT